MNIFILVSLSLTESVESDNLLLAISSGFFLIGGLPYGIFLSKLDGRRIKSREFSCPIRVYQVGSWLGWIILWSRLSGYLMQMGQV